ncbi:hypothetical protein Lepto7375DRAFT_4971 [Leptolyngbya sp. PCC 7375]|nr:hypothetical protein Lepto7375DRAFT_4971 [Leptolyngbya sp. PCC 7375]
MSGITPAASGPNAAESKVFFGVVLELDGQEIALQPQNAITEIKEKGIEVGLPAGERVVLGTVGERLKGILEALGVDDISFLKADGTLDETQLPDIPAIQTAVNLLTQANLAIEDFHLRIPPTGTSATAPSKEETAYTVGLSATWTGDAGTLIESLDLKLKGLYFKVSNEEG